MHTCNADCYAEIIRLGETGTCNVWDAQAAHLASDEMREDELLAEYYGL